MKYERLTISSKNIVQQFENIKPENRNEFCLKCFDRLAELEDKIEKGTLIDIKTISGLLNEWFECPCNFTLNEEDVALYMFEKYGDWCEKNCDKMLEDYSPCWEMYLKAKLKELQE